MNYVNQTARSGADDETALMDRLLAMTEAALRFLPSDKIELQARQWLSGVPWIVHDGHRAVARSLALEFAFITPSLLGMTAFDRLARATKTANALDMTAMTLLRRSAPRVARLTDQRFEDLATGEKRTLLPSPPSVVSGGGDVFGRFAVTADGRAVATGMLLRLDPETLEVARGFMRGGGRGLTNPLRCAEALYRFTVRRGMSEARKPKLPFNPDTNPLDALAAHWASLDGDPGPDEIAKARDLVGMHALLNAMISVSIARHGGEGRLADAYRRISAAIVEFMALRQAHGSARSSLDRAAAEVDAAIARGQCGVETKHLFDDLARQARLAAGKPRGASDDLDKLVQRIQALRAKTIERGCTEQEAMAAAEKVAELLDRHGLSVSELDLRRQACEGLGVETGRKRRGPIDDCIGTIAAFFDCRVWGETAEDNTLRWIFFGLPGDVQAAVYLHDLIVLAFATETAVFQGTALYQELHSGRRRSATNSFQVGMARGITGKLTTLRRARDAAASGNTGRALVPVKQSIIDAEMERLGLSLRRLNKTRRTILVDAFEAGKEAGEKFDYRPGIEA